MTAISSRWCRGRGAWAALLAVTAAAAGGCAKQPAPAVQQSAVRQVGPRATPAPSFRTLVDSTSRAALLAYAHGLQFDSTSYGADAQYVTLRRGGRIVLGAFLAVAPEIGAAALTDQEVAQGRILSRLKVSAAAPGFSLASGVYYVWVDSTGGSYRALIVPEAAGVRVWHASVRPEPDGLPGGAQFGAAVVRIVTTEAEGFRLLNDACGVRCCGTLLDSLH